MKALKVMAVLLTALMTLSVPVAAGTVNTADNTDITNAIELTTDEKTYGTCKDGNAYWYSYSPDSDGDYAISVLEKTVRESCWKNLNYQIFDETGEILSDQSFNYYGRLSSTILNMETGNTFFIKLFLNTSELESDYLITVQKVEEGVLSNPLHTDTSKISQTLSEKTSITMEDAIAIPVNEKMTGELIDFTEWLAFETDGTDDKEYTISAVRTNSGNKGVSMILCDSLGNKLAEEALDENGFYTNITQSLEANSIYYIYFVCDYQGYATGYNLTIKTEDSAATSPSKPASEAPETGEEPTQEDELFD